ncbi:hypothetical protein [Helicobacter sp. 11S02596-1]|uniref:hypothetical protein n=1 Tax=Helicobacter sp. 11S02596-1 TaxID=1476194 RepID=UPI000BA51228|nr:hypothetical protein [Helicobacter sp. 11S02596-1]PAF42767.1 hypothetical protein BJI48_05745 [Helicobacter sp. 11S02596-1]
MDWIDRLKIAILEGDTQKAYELVTHLPKDSFKDMDSLLIAQELIAQTIEMLENDQEKVKKQMLQIKMAKKFLE